jgi:hypothetical protein
LSVLRFLTRSVVLLTTLLSAISGSLAQGEAICVAVPGRSFGPLSIGDPPPPGWDVSCQGEHDEVASDYYYMRWGLLAHVARDKRWVELMGVGMGRIDGISVQANDIVDPSMYDTTGAPGTGHCITVRRTRVVAPFAFRRPSGVRYVTNRGVELGASISNVIGAHSVPARSRNFESAEQVQTLNYCGIAFTFEKGGRAVEIAIYPPHIAGAPCIPSGSGSR